MRRTISLTNVLLLIAFMTSFAFADVNRFAGHWKNTDSKTGGITNIEITREDNKIAVQIYGKCHPTDCVWKKSYAVAYAPNVELDSLSNAKALSVVIDAGFAEKIVTLRFVGDNALQAEIFTRFTDRSKRSNTFHTETFSLKQDK